MGWLSATAAQGDETHGTAQLGKAGQLHSKTQVNTDEVRRAFQTGKTGLTKTVHRKY